MDQNPRKDWNLIIDQNPKNGPKSKNPKLDQNSEMDQNLLMDQILNPRMDQIPKNRSKSKIANYKNKLLNNLWSKFIKSCVFRTFIPIKTVQKTT